MTNEEIRLAAVGVIQERSNELVPGTDVPNLRRNIENAIRKAVSQAYEEAASKASNAANWHAHARPEMQEDGVYLLGWEDAEKAIAASIRALKDSLCQHEWTDVRNEVVTSGEMCLKCGAVRAGNVSSVNEPVSSS